MGRMEFLLHFLTGFGEKKFSVDLTLIFCLIFFCEPNRRNSCFLSYFLFFLFFFPYFLSNQTTVNLIVLRHTRQRIQLQKLTDLFLIPENYVQRQHDSHHLTTRAQPPFVERRAFYRRKLPVRLRSLVAEPLYSGVLGQRIWRRWSVASTIARTSRLLPLRNSVLMGCDLRF